MARIITVSMQKGGVGKTTTTVNLAGAFATHFRFRTLVIDVEQQRNATTAILGKSTPAPTLEDVFEQRASLAEAVHVCEYEPNLFVVPGTRSLPIYEERYSATKDSFFRGMRDLIRSVGEDYDIVLIDTPPAGAFWLHMSLTAAHGYLLVGQPEAFCEDAVLEMVETAQHIRQQLNPNLELEGVLMNMVQSRLNEHRGYLTAYEDVFKDQLLPPLPHRTVVKESQRTGRILEHYDPSSDLIELYRDIARRIVARHHLSVPTAA